MEVFFTQAWDGSPSGEVAKRFSERLDRDAEKSLSIAMYGIDDIKGSMSTVYNSILKKAQTSSIDVRAVVDVSGFEKGSAWYFDYVRPEEKSNQDNWIFGTSKTGVGMHSTFQYDGTNLRVHFAPTDDAEHRVILPMLLSAKAGDEIRISMFGGTGYEIIRTMQYAVAKGANVRIVFDSKLGHGLTSWTRDSILNVFMKNPYIGRVGLASDLFPGAISVRSSTWKGKNHYKVGTLTRKDPSGQMREEQIIIGSQNWSGGGNDHNDENLISIQHLKKDVRAAVLFNQEFDNRLWVKPRDERPRSF